ncbi:hypothetical protein WME98_11840 [Sorangium sp. So ce296]|uniref:hypothetical protein n=1 Tax=Sorangium sp. So ce296 TaxID=3133296 RepID=UPI003F608656
MPSFVIGSGKPGARIVSRTTRAEIPVTDSTFFCESIAGCGAVMVRPSSGIASVTVAVASGRFSLGVCHPPTGASGIVRSIGRMPLSA